MKNGPPEGFTSLKDLWQVLKDIVKAIPDAITGFIDALGKITIPGPLQDLANLIGGIISGLDKIAASAGVGGSVVSPEMEAAAREQFPNLHDFVGPYSANRVYAIGRGAQPELFVPNSSGMAYPAGSWPGGGLNIETVNVYGVQDVPGFYDALQQEAKRRNMALARPAGASG